MKFRNQKIPNISRIIKGFRSSCPNESQSANDENNKNDENGKETATAANVSAPAADNEVVDCTSVAHIECDSDSSESEEEVVEHVEASIINNSQDANKTADLDALRKNLSSYPTVDSLPNKNDFIGFRVLKMAANYVPELSDYIIGLVESVDTDTMAMEIVILAGNEELKQHQDGGKFSLPDCDDTLVNIDDRTLHCNWVELKDVRLVDVSLLA